MTVIFVSPAEPAKVREAVARKLTEHQVRTSRFPEDRGVDFLWRDRDAWWGVQRKELRDLLASMQDGRLAREVGMMRHTIETPMVVIERRPVWTNDGALVEDVRGMTFSYRAWCGLLASLAREHVGVIQTDNLSQTIDAIGALVQWTRKPSHTVANSRPGPATDGWGKPTNRDWGMHLLQGIPGVGPGVASALFDQYGRVPMQWTISEAELRGVPGVGVIRAHQMMEALGTP